MNNDKQIDKIALLMCQLTKEQQIIIDNITDKGLLDIIDIYKNTLS